MNIKVKIYILCLCALLSSCLSDSVSRTGSYSNDENQKKDPIDQDKKDNDLNDDKKQDNDTSLNNNFKITGKIQKGPFIQGTNVFIRELDSKLKQTGISFFTQTEDNTGLFKIDVEMSTPFAEIIATGPYFNEITGQVSDAIITLRAIVNLSETPVVNVNILTDMTRNRIAKLVEEGKSINEARTQAEAEVARFFGYNEEEIIDFQTLDISEDGVRNSALLAVSAITQQNHTASTLQEFVSKLGHDLKDNGQIDDENLINKVRENSQALDLTQIRQNLENRYLNIDSIASIPSFENFIDTDGDAKINGIKPTQIFIIPERDIEELNEGDKIKLKIHLGESRPNEDININVNHNLENKITLSKNSLTFTPDNYTTTQEIEIDYYKNVGNHRNNNSLIVTASADNLEPQTIQYTLIENQSFHLTLPENENFTDEEPFFIGISFNEHDVINGEIQVSISSNHAAIYDIYPEFLTFNHFARNPAQFFRVIPKKNFNSEIENESIQFTLSSTSHEDVIPLEFDLEFNQFIEPRFSFAPYISAYEPSGVNGSSQLAFKSDREVLAIASTDDGGEGRLTTIYTIEQNSMTHFTGVATGLNADGNRDEAVFLRISDIGKVNESDFYVLDESLNRNIINQYLLRIVRENGNVETIFNPDYMNLRDHHVIPLSENKYYFIRKNNFRPNCLESFYLDLEESPMANFLVNEDQSEFCPYLRVLDAKFDGDRTVYILERFEEISRVRKLVIDPNNPRLIRLENPILGINSWRDVQFEVDEDQNIYVIDLNQASMKKFNSEGQLLHVYENPFHFLPNNLDFISAKLLHHDNEIFLSIREFFAVSIQHRYRILKLEENF